jgi:hypothetical protein
MVVASTDNIQHTLDSEKKVSSALSTVLIFFDWHDWVSRRGWEQKLYYRKIYYVLMKEFLTTYMYATCNKEKGVLNLCRIP